MPFAIISGVHVSDRQYIREMLQLLFSDLLGLHAVQTTIHFLADDPSAPTDQRVVAQISSKKFSTMDATQLEKLAEGVIDVLEMNGSAFNEVMFVAALHVLARPNRMPAT